MGDSDPFAAVQQAVEGDGFDEIIISALPARASHRLLRHLPQRVRRLAGPSRWSRRAGAPSPTSLSRRRLRPVSTPPGIADTTLFPSDRWEAGMIVNGFIEPVTKELPMSTRSS